MSENTPNPAEAAASLGASDIAARSRPDKLGRISMYLAIAVLVLSVAASILIAAWGTTMDPSHQTIINGHSTTVQTGYTAVPNETALLLQFTFGTILGIGAIVLGIIAVVRKMGRRFGVAAIAIAVAAPVLSLLAWAVLVQR